ncbi:MAG: FAD binding domain-containing protein [Streptosporangiaceae bacterium]
MATVSAYWRPDTVENAIALLQRQGAVPVGGGTKVNAAPGVEPVEIVDLQALGLDCVEPLPSGVSIGALATLQRIAEDVTVPAAAREAARREEPSTLRAVATLGGCVAAARFDSEFLATLLAYDAVVTLTGPEGEQDLSLEALLAARWQLHGRIIKHVAIATDGVTFAARTGRTSADRPIVAAVARRAADGRRLALTGVAGTPVLVSEAGANGLGWLHQLDPPGDFRGSGAYRRALAAILAKRVLEAIG